VSAVELVRRLYEAYQARDWETASSFLHDDATVAMPATAERLDGRDGVIDFQRAYTEPWGDLSVLRVVGDEELAAAEVEVVAPDDTFRMAAFWRAEDGVLREGVEYWVTVGGEEPPPERQAARPGESR
jgi:ketosteroid isomerase-like protein